MTVVAEGEKAPTGARRVLRAVLRAVAGLTFSFVLALTTMVAWLESGPRRVPDRTVRDVTELVRIDVDHVASPTSADEVRALVSRHDGPISIGGGRFSMGGQIATDGTLFLDVRGLDDVLAIDVEGRTVRVEAGITWRKLIEALDAHDLSVRIMQSYADFTVGGTLSVNAHGRYVNEGPVVRSVRAIELVLADGSLVRASRDENADLFWGTVGGYGALGVIVAAELDVVPNQKLARTVERMPVEGLRGYFADHVAGSPTAVMFNADLYPPDYDEMVAITFSDTDADVTVAERVQPPGGSTRVDQFVYWWVSEAPLGKQARSDVIDKMRLASQPVVWRNYEATYDVRGLDPGSRARSTYVLQEYFIPIDQFDAFVPKMRAVFQGHDVNVVNVSIRHALPDPDTLLGWAPVECFAFVVYHKQGTSEADQAAVGVWTRAMIDEILAVGGTYYLPYQIHATPAQFHAAYPRAVELFDLKRRVDPDYAFRSKLWDAYLPPTAEYGGAHDEERVRKLLAARPGYARPEDQTFLTLPEWLIVYSADELGAFLTTSRPSEFPYFAAIGQFWTLYRTVWGTTRARYDFNAGYHAMIGVIGVSYTVEYAAKGLYEHTFGRFTEWWSGPDRAPEEDRYAAITADYGAFVHHTPWYAYPFAEKRSEMATIPDAPGSLRRTERRIAVWTELTAKGLWGSAMGGASGAAYGAEAGTIEAWVRPGAVDLRALGVEVAEDLGGGDVIVRIPRYEPFTEAVRLLAAVGVEIVEVAGGRTMLVQVVADEGWAGAPLWGDVLVEWPILTEPGRKRVALEVAVRRLDEVLPALDAEGVRIEHLYDY